MENFVNAQNKNEELKTTDNTITLPVKSSFFYYQGDKIFSEIKFINFNPVKGILTAQGIDLYGDFNLNGKINFNHDSEENIPISFLIEKVYDTHIIEISFSLKLNEKKLEGLWKSPMDSIYDINKTVEIELDLFEYNCEILIDEKMLENKNLNFFSSTNKILLSNENNSSEYTGFLISSDENFSHSSLNLIEGNVYDITHVIYCYTIARKSDFGFEFEKNYFSGKFDENLKKFILTKSELI
jgi:hypothetical protein